MDQQARLGTSGRVLPVHGTSSAARMPDVANSVKSSNVTELMPWAISLLALAVALVGRLFLAPLLGESFPLVTVFGAVATAAWVGGRVHAIAVALVGYVAGVWLFIHPVVAEGPGVELVRFLLFGATSAIIIVFREVTSRANTLSYEAAVLARRQQELLKLTLESIGDAVITTDADGRISYLNPVASALTGWTNDDALGRPLTSVFHVLEERSRTPIADPAETALRDGRAEGSGNHTILVGRDGTERMIDRSVAPIIDASGRALGAVLVFHDVTERRKAERALEHSEERLRLAQAVARIGSFEWDIPSNRFEWTEELSVIYGRRPEEVPGEGFAWHETVHPDDRDEVARKTIESIQTGIYEHEWRILWPDGTERWVQGRGAAFFDEDGKPQRMLGVNIDITDRKRAEEALREADRNKDQFLATLAHELRNPLAPVRNALDILRLGGSDPRLLEDARAMMERQVAHLVRLIDDLLDVSRITRNRLELRTERVELAAIVEQAAETCRSRFEGSAQTFVVRLPEEPVRLDADPVRLAQVFGNLLTNASKYTARGGTITLDARVEHGDVIASVSDTGVGIPPDKLPQVFEMFTQIDRSLEQSRGGLGIGLALVKRLVELHGGSVTASSDGPGRGSTFTIRLPLADAAPATVPEADEQGEMMEDASNRPHRRILVVDDNEDAAMTLAMLLNMKGSETCMAHDGFDAVEKAAEFRPDVILLDIGLPGMDGYDACREIRKQPWGTDITMIALTGWGQDDDRRRSMEAGFDLHLVKPVAPATLMKALSDA